MNALTIRHFFIFVIIFSHICFFLIVENKAIKCGMSFINGGFSSEVRPDWFNGGIIFVNNEGLFSLFHGGNVSNKDKKISKFVTQINKYFNNEGNIFVEFSSNGSYYFAKINTEGVLLIGEDDFDSSNFDWISVLPESCFYGRVNVIRLYFLSMFLLLVFFVFSRNNK